MNCAFLYRILYNSRALLLIDLVFQHSFTECLLSDTAISLGVTNMNERDCCEQGWLHGCAAFLVVQGPILRRPNAWLNTQVSLS